LTCRRPQRSEQRDRRPAITSGVRDAGVEKEAKHFRLAGLDGTVVVAYGPNTDPRLYGYDLLGLDYPAERAKGFPVLRADVAYEGEGYSANFGWVQVVWIRQSDTNEPRVIVDVAPQLRGLGVPYFSFGVEPTLFDAPSTTDADEDWLARAFLVTSPDRLMTRAVQPIVGFRWGYVLRDHVPQITPFTWSAEEDWREVSAVLTTRFPEWTFSLQGEQS
jgi:hypothetical protein